MTDIKFVLEVARNGAREPSIIYNFTKWRSPNFSHPNELTQLGAQQHYDLGEYVRTTYFADKDLTSMKDAGIFAQAVDANRTRQSATSQLQGLFGTEMTWPDQQPDLYPLIMEQD